MTAEDRIYWALVKIIIGAAVVAAVVVFFAMKAFAQHPNHGNEHWYAQWMMPSNRSVSCCSNLDCAAAQSRLVNGKWQSRYSDAEEWIDIPDFAVEAERDSPDGRSHLCARKSWYGATVLCFLPAGSS